MNNATIYIKNMDVVFQRNEILNKDPILALEVLKNVISLIADIPSFWQGSDAVAYIKNLMKLKDPLLFVSQFALDISLQADQDFKRIVEIQRVNGGSYSYEGPSLLLDLDSRIAEAGVARLAEIEKLLPELEGPMLVKQERIENMIKRIEKTRDEFTNFVKKFVGHANDVFEFWNASKLHDQVVEQVNDFQKKSDEFKGYFDDTISYLKRVSQNYATY